MLDKNIIESVIFCIILFIILYFSITYYNNRNHTYVKADDGNEYRVQITEDNKESANLLSDAITRVKTLLDHLKKSESQDIRTETLLSRFNPNNITENDPQEMKSGVTSYTVNKGEKIVVCLRQRNNDFVEINTLMYVIIHELAHICDLTSQQHDEKFWNNFEWLLEHAVNIGIYNYVDYSKDQEPYCGMNITSNVLDDK
jgi:predicted metal-dependent hydrolase